MPKDFIEELEWRGLIHDLIPETKKQLQEPKIGYIGFDPTADSLHVGSLIPIILLKHFQNYGHKPLVVMGGATGMIGDPSGKSKERNLLDKKTLSENIFAIKKQMQHFLDFNEKNNGAVLVNNYDWTEKMAFIDFARDIGKHITVNYMMGKESVKKRIKADEKEGMSFTEFTYQLLQGYDFLYLYENYKCTLQMGGADQWGNITTGTELIRKKAKGKAFGLTCPLITKADGTKFGKTEQGNIWLHKNKTSVYAFYQYWLNTSDVDAEGFIKKFTFLDKETIFKITQEHKEMPHLRILQKKLAKELTLFVHSKKDYENALKASQILFGKSTAADLKKLDAITFLEIFKGVPQKTISKTTLEKGTDLTELFVNTNFLPSNSELRRALKEKSILVNKEKVSENDRVDAKNLIAEKYILLQRGKKKYFLLKVV